MKYGIWVGLAVLFVSPRMAFAQEDPTRAGLDYHLKMYAEYQHSKFDLGGEPSRFAWLETPGLFPHAAIAHNKTRELKTVLNPKISEWSVKLDGQAMRFDDYVSQEQKIDSIVVLHKGHIVYQRYKTHGPLDRHLSMSVTKVVTAAALARLEAMGKVNMQSPVKNYLEDFNDTAWSDISLQNVIDMTSGIDCRDSDGYQNTDGCVYRAEEALGVVVQVRDEVTSSREFLKQVDSHRPSGEETEYVSSNTNIAAMVIEAVTHKPFSRAVSELLWQPMGAEADGLMLINQYGEAYGSGGLSARLNDIARFGLLHTNNNQGWLSLNKAHRDSLKNKPRPLFSEQEIKGMNTLFDGDAPLHSRWQWDFIWEDGDMYKDGYSGQGLYVSPKNDLVLAWFGTADTDFRVHRLLPLSRKMSKAGLFESN